jgi:YVTN family beta-propeller protein
MRAWRQWRSFRAARSPAIAPSPAAANCGRGPEGSPACSSNERDGTVTVIDLGAARVAPTVEVGARPRGIRLSPDGRKLYAAGILPNDVAVIDAAANSVVANTKVGDGPRGRRRPSLTRCPTG